MSNIFPPIVAPLIRETDLTEKVTVTGTIVEIANSALTLDNGQSFDWAANGDVSDFRVGQRVTVTFSPNRAPADAEVRLAD
jgi:hypothetical protein